MLEYKGRLSGRVQMWLHRRNDRASMYLGNALSSLRYRIWRWTGGRHYGEGE